MLPQKRRGRRRAVRLPSTIKDCRAARKVPSTGWVTAAEKSARLDMRVLHEIRRRIDRQARDAVFLHQLGEIFLEKARRERRHLRVDIVGMLAPQVAVDPFRIVELRVVVVPDLEQYRPMILRDEKRDPTVLALGTDSPARCAGAGCRRASSRAPRRNN